MTRTHLQSWLSPQGAEPVEWVDRFAVCVATLRFVEAQQPAKPEVRTIEARVLVRELDTKIRRAKLPQPDTRRVGESFGAEFSEWLVRLSMAIGTGAPATR